MKEKSFVSAVVYVHNAEDRIERFMTSLCQTLEEGFEHSEIICVNDVSSDNSVSIIRDLAGRLTGPTISVINMSYYHGLEMAMNAGIDLSIGDFVLEFDTTCMDYEGSLIMDVYHRAMEGYDMVSAVPGRRERFTSRLFYRLTKSYSDLSLDMHTETFRVVSRRMINRVKAMNATTPYRKIVYASAGLKACSVGYTPSIDAARREETRGGYRSGLALDSLLLFTQVGYRAAMLLTVIMMLVSVFMVLYSVVFYLIGHPVEGWTTTIVFLSFAFFGLFAILTVVIKYLQLLVNLVFRRKQYSFEGIEKLSK